MLIISLDAVGDDEFERLLEYPAFSAVASQAAIYRGLPAIPVSNTYPVHTSIVTGVVPGVHGLISNTERFPKKNPVWNDREDMIRVKTIWQAAARRGINTAAVFWPVTAHSPTVRYNIPEVLPRPGKSQVAASLRAGSKLLQLNMVLRHRKLLSGIGQPNRDNFAAACMADILRENDPGLALIHFTAYDSFCHEYGKGSEELKPALESLDNNLSLLLEAAGDERDVIIFTDHSQVNVHNVLEPNEVLVNEGLLGREDDEYIPGGYGCYIECCGGSAFFHAGSLPKERVIDIKSIIEHSEGFRRFFSDDEMKNSGYGDTAFGFCAQHGSSYVAFKPGHNAEHGYPPDTPDYKVFYMARLTGAPQGVGGSEAKQGNATPVDASQADAIKTIVAPDGVTQTGSLLDIAPLVAKRLNLELTHLAHK